MDYWLPQQATPQSLHLEERKKLQSVGQFRSKNNKAIRREILAQLVWWRDCYFDGKDEMFKQYLRTFRLNRHTILPLLSIDANPLGTHRHHRPESLNAPSRRFALAAGGMPKLSKASSAQFSGAFVSLTDWASTQLAKRIEQMSRADTGLSVDGAVLDQQFRRYLKSVLDDIASPTFVLRLHAAKLSGRLRAAGSRERFKEFVSMELVENVKFAALLADFPVLGRLLTRTTRQALDFWSETLQRLSADWTRIRQAFSRPNAPDKLIEFEAGLGDLHGAGRSTTQLRFLSGWRLVYKPRPVAVCAHFQELLRWFNRKGLKASLLPVNLINRGNYGWMEHVQAKGCTKRSQIEAFYARQGALLFLLYLLDGADIHQENLIAAGEYPILVDVEALFHNAPSLDPHSSLPEDIRDAAARQLVTSTLLLPTFAVGNAGAVDVSGSAGETRRSPSLVPLWRRKNTDEMHLLMKRRMLARTSNIPKLCGKLMRIARNGEAFVEGFESAYRLALRYRDELGARGGPLYAFRRDWVRHIARPTEIYQNLLWEGFHPSCLRDAVERDFLFGTLGNSRKGDPYLALLASERSDLWYGDVPVFRARVNSRSLVDSRGKHICKFFNRSGLERVLTRLRRFGSEDLSRQIYCVRLSLATVPHKATQRRIPLMRPGSDAAREADLMKQAVQIGERLSQLAVRERGEAHWLGLLPLSNGKHVAIPVDASLYGGTAGIALFLAYLGHITNERRFRRLACAAFEEVRRQIL